MFKRILVMSLLLAVAATAWALRPDFVVSGNQPHGVVTGAVERPSQNLFAVTIVEVNGQKVGARTEGLSLAPGTYTITAANAQVDTRMTGALPQTRRGDRPDMNIELEVEAGKTYYVALEARGNDRNQWSLVNWRTVEH